MLSQRRHSGADKWTSWSKRDLSKSDRVGPETFFFFSILSAACGASLSPSSLIGYFVNRVGRPWSVGENGSPTPSKKSVSLIHCIL